MHKSVSSLSVPALDHMVNSKAEVMFCFTREEWAVYRHRYLQLRLRQKTLHEQTNVEVLYQFFHWLAYLCMRKRYKTVSNSIRPLLAVDTGFIWHQPSSVNQMEVPESTCVEVTGKGFV